MWSIVEEQLAITCANLPLLGRVFASCLPKGWLSSARQKYGSTTYGTSQRKNGSQLNYGLTRMVVGVNKTNVSTRRAEIKDGSMRMQWSDTKDSTDSDTELAPHGAALDGIHISREFHVGSQVWWYHAIPFGQLLEGHVVADFVEGVLFVVLVLHMVLGSPNSRTAVIQ